MNRLLLLSIALLAVVLALVWHVSTEPPRTVAAPSLPPADLITPPLPEEELLPAPAVRETIVEDAQLEPPSEPSPEVPQPRARARVHMHGQVWIANERATHVVVRSRVGDSDQTGPSSMSGDGSYDLEFPGPGPYGLGIWGDEGLTYLWLPVDVPDADEFEHDLVVPAGRISGRVLAPDGSPVTDVRIEARQTSDGTWGSGWGKTTTDERGEYELLLPAAMYEVRVALGGPADPARSFARPTISDVVVINLSHLRGVDFQLVEGSTIDGVVRLPDGSPARYAELFIGPQGKAARSDPLGRADMNGLFHVEGIPAGRHLVTARHGESLARWQKLETRPGSKHELEFQVAATE